jgi:ParB family transcriptional regulator, chromosome partitioning protein
MSLELDHLGSMDLYLGEKGTQGDMGGLAQIAAEQGVGQPVQLPLDLVDEDPNQPRREFDEEALQELAQTIALRGVRQPVSVRPHPQVPGRWMLNFGARRYRASRLAGKAQIPAFVDETADTYDQVIENEQREGLRPLDLALFVQQRLSLGETQADIARQLGKSRAYVTVATALIEAPDWLLAAYREGRCRGLRELYELRQLHTRLGDQVAQWASAQLEITRPELAAYKSAAMRAVESAEQGTAPRQGSALRHGAGHPGPRLGRIGSDPEP